jgi:DNA recombination protein RmuC
MEAWTYLLILLAGIGLGAGLCWALRASTVARLRITLQVAEAAEKGRVEELAEVRRQAEDWRSRHEAEQLERARFETEARRAGELDAELQQARGRLEGLGAEKAALEAEAARLPGLEGRIVVLADETAGLRAAKAQLQTQIEQQALAHAEKVAALTEIRCEIGRDLKNIAADALRDNQGTFLEIANELFGRHRAGAGEDLEARQKAVEALVGPLREALETHQRQIDTMEKDRAQSYGALSAELKSVAETQNAVRSETSKLVNALRAAPKTRGRWGEHTLRNVLELSGLSSYCDFSTEESFDRDGSMSRPDVVIRLPGSRSIVIDAKTSLAAYLDAVEATDEAERERHLALHAAQIRGHVKTLAAKSYWDGLTVTPDFVVMFVPGDNFYAAAVEKDPALFEDAAAQRVIIVTPATLIALAKAVAFGWRQEKVAENAQRVHALGRELYRRMLTMTGHIGRCGDALSKSVRHYNDFIGSLEHSVMPQARRFNELEVEGTATDLAVLDSIEIEPRLLRSDRDFAELAAAPCSSVRVASAPA